MDATDGPPDPLVVPTLRDLIKRHGDETGESNRALGERSGVSHQTLSYWMNETIKTFPDPGTMRRFAQATGHTEQTVLLAAARSIGLRVSDRGTPLVNSLPPGTDILDPADIAAIRAVVRQLVAARRQPAPAPDLASVDGLRLAEDAGKIADMPEIRNGTVR
jgi:transcriptional regulator with XRE-family HTH domain